MFLQYTVCEAAKAAGVWDTAPYVEEIPQEALKYESASLYF